MNCGGKWNSDRWPEDRGHENQMKHGETLEESHLEVPVPRCLTFGTSV